MMNFIAEVNLDILGVYFIFNLFLFCMGGYLFIKTTPDLMKKKQYSVFKTFIIVFELYLIANTLWTTQEFDIISLPKWLFTLVCFVSLSTALLNCFCFYTFSMIYFGYSNTNKPLYEFFGFLPFLVVFIILIISMFTGAIFYIDENIKICQGPYYHILVFCSAIYFAIILISSIVELFRSKSPQAKKNCLTISAVVVFLVVWIIFDDAFDGLTIIPMAIFMVLFSLFIAFQQTSINTDALTGLNNRRRALEYLSSQIPSISDETPLYLYICDINRFKEINDNYGHLEGDNALMMLAESIKEVVDKIFGFSARYGGDEFIILIKDNNVNYDEYEVIRKIDDLVKAKCILLKKSYDITVAFGCVRCSDATINAETYIKEADDRLYINKKQLA